MTLIREDIGRIPIAGDKDAAYSALLASIRRLGFTVEQEDRTTRRIVIRCFTPIANLLVWRCWSENLVFEIDRSEQGHAIAKVYAVPNLFRIRAPKGERQFTASDIVVQVRGALERG